MLEPNDLSADQAASWFDRDLEGYYAAVTHAAARMVERDAAALRRRTGVRARLARAAGRVAEAARRALHAARTKTTAGDRDA